MEKNKNTLMRVGTIGFMTYPELTHGDSPRTLERIAQLLKDPYFSAVELNWIKDPHVRAQAARLLAQSGVTVCYGAQPRFLTTGLNLNDLDEGRRAQAVASLKEGIDEAYELGAAGLAFLSGKYEESRKEEAYAALLRSTKEACAYAKGKGSLRIELEVFDFDVDKKSLIGPAPLAARFAADVRKEYPDFGLVVDLSHFPLVHETVREAILPVKDFITHVHIGNAVVKEGCEAYGDQHPRFGFPNSANGQEDLVEFLRTLLEIGFFNEENPPVLSFEVKPFGQEDPDVVLAGCKRFLDAAWARV